jgi:hypothetical protein
MNALTPPTWPQDSLRIPNASGRFMPPIERGNFDVARQESFTMSTTFTYNGATDGQQLAALIETDQDGDFWCDQILCVGWEANLAQMEKPRPATVQISDVRTGRAITFPAAGAPINFFSTLQLGPGDSGIVIGSAPPPAGFRSTSTLPQPFCFTRQGGIQIVLTFVGGVPAGLVRTIDFGFSGWKEYAYASQGQT